MKRLIILGIVICAGTLYTHLSAQVIEGKVTDASQQGIDGATVILQSADSVFIEATITDKEGNFHFRQKRENYCLTVQHLLFQTIRKCFQENNIRHHIIMHPKDNQLREIIIEGEKPLLKMEGNKLIYDITQLTNTKLVTNAYEVIRNLPGIMEYNGTLTLARSGSVNILLNDKVSSMTYEQILTLLKSMPASRVEKVEIMYTTPPQYHVRGASINIHTPKHKTDEGKLQGEINGAYSQKQQSDGEGGITLAYTSQKFDADFTYHFTNEYSRQGNSLETLHTVDGNQHHVCQNFSGEGRSNTHLLKIGSTYKFTSQSSLSLDYTTSLTPDDQNTLTASGNQFASENISNSQIQVHNLSLYLTSASGLKTGADYTYYRNIEDQHFQTLQPVEALQKFLSSSRQVINRCKIYADQHHIFNQAWQLDYGTSFSYVTNSNRQQYDAPTMSKQNLNSRIKEYTYNLYAGSEYKFNKKLSLSASVSLEFYKMVNYKKWAIYPTLQLGYIISPFHLLQFSFNSDKTYPSYWVMSGAINHIDNYQVTIGNTYLKPYTDYSAHLSYILKRKYIFQMRYSHRPHYFTQMMYLPPNELKSIYNYQNWDYMNQLTFSSILPFKIGKWWSSRLSLSAILKHDKASHYFDAPFDRKQWTGIGIWNNTFTLSQKPDIKIELSAFGQTKGIQGSYTIKPMGKTDAAIRYTFLNQAASIQLRLNDIFNSMNPYTTIRNGVQIADMSVKRNQRSLTLSFSYKFKGFKEKEVKEIDTQRFGL